MLGRFYAWVALAWAGAAAAPEAFSIPYPNGSMYLEHGIEGSFSGGWYHNYGDTLGLYQWQGAVEYYYTPWFSGGVGFKMNAGEPSDSTQTVLNRFFLIGRVHKAWNQAAVYTGAQFGFDNLNISLQSPSDSVGFFRAPLVETNASFAWEWGLGWKFSRFAGATLGQRIELSLVGQNIDNVEGSVNMRTLPGVAVDLLALFPPLRETVKAFYLFNEYQFGRLFLESGSHTRDFAWILGSNLAF